MKIALIQQNYTIGDLEGNASKIVEAARFAASRGAEVAIFPAEALTGTPLFDMARAPKFITARELHSHAISELIPEGLRVVFSSESIPEAEIHCAAREFSHGTPQQVAHELTARAKTQGITQVWVNQVGAQTDTIFFGGSMVCFPTGEVVSLPLFEESIRIVDLTTPCNSPAPWGDRMEQLHRALVMGIRDYFRKNGCSDACIALSGGIDSAVVVALAVEALGAEHVRTLMLPSEYSSDHSVDDSLEMNRRLGIRGDLVSIAPLFATASESLTEILNSAPEASAALARENMQARIRLMLTMALSNSHSSLMLNTSNKSEAAVGYGTLYGDTSGALSVIGDLYKGDVYALARHINATSPYGEVIPENIITKEPSAELRPDQRDSDSLPDYPTLDAVLERLIERGLSSDKVIAEGFEPQVVERICRLLAAGDFKRYQLPPALRVSGCSFGSERRYPITARKTF